jgi:hypothetical protein
MRRTATLAWMLYAAMACAQESTAPAAPPAQMPAQTPAPAQPPAQTKPTPPTPAPIERIPPPEPPPPAYNKAIFQKPFPPDQLKFLSGMLGVPSGAAYSNKDFHKLMKAGLPNPTFHYGVDLSAFDAFDQVIEGSQVPVQIRNGRYFMLSGAMGKHHSGRGVIWIDLEDGLMLGAFYFTPGNGEPTPTITIFSKQIKVNAISLHELPPAFADDLTRWSMQTNVPRIETRYFIGNEDKKILLEHDEDYCVSTAITDAPDKATCEQMNADAADTDLTAASYLEQTHYATNATAHMIQDPDSVAWLAVRGHTCDNLPDPLACRVRLTHERIRVVMHQPPRHR